MHCLLGCWPIVKLYGPLVFRTLANTKLLLCIAAVLSVISTNCGLLSSTASFYRRCIWQLPRQWAILEADTSEQYVVLRLQYLFVTKPPLLAASYPVITWVITTMAGLFGCEGKEEIKSLGPAQRSPQVCASRPGPRLGSIPNLETSVSVCCVWHFVMETGRSSLSVLSSLLSPSCLLPPKAPLPLLPPGSAVVQCRYLTISDQSAG